MALDLNEIREVAKKRNKNIPCAIAHQERLKFHIQPYVSTKYSASLTNFLSWVKNLLPTDKFKLFKSLFRYPVYTNGITDICFNKLSRIFEGRNPAFNYQFKNPEQRDDWEYYRKEVLNEPKIWATKGWDYFKTEINSVLVVDIPEEQDKADKYPQPYFYWLPINQVVNYKYNCSNGSIEWIVFKQSNDTIAVIDDKYYRKFVVGKSNQIEKILIESKHDLGYCPCKFFWDEPMNIEKPDVKESPITKELDNLDWLLFFHISKRNLDICGSYPIYSGYEQECDFENSDNGDYCDGGFLKNKQGTYKIDNSGLLEKCPKCGDKRTIGAGSFVDVPIPVEGQPDLRNPVQILGVDVDSLNYNVKEEERIQTSIISSVVGLSNENNNKQALNEMQVASSFESQNIVLEKIKKGFEDSMQFVDETVCRLRYGSAFISSKINLGTEFYVANISDLRMKYKIAKESGASDTELDAIKKQIIETEYRNNPTMLRRMLILMELEPFSHLTTQEVIDLYEKGLIKRETLQIKMDFSNFVRRFERENINILDFGIKIPYKEKIDIINKKLEEYASKEIN